MSLKDFNTYVTENATSVKQKRTNISDRLKVSNGKKEETTPKTENSSWRGKGTSAERLSVLATKKPSYKGDLNSEKQFPILVDTEITTVEMGAWSRGISSIVAAKDLPEPKYREQVVIDDDGDSDYSDYSDDDAGLRTVRNDYQTYQYSQPQGEDDPDWEKDI